MTFCDEFYDCESTVGASEDTREKLEADLKTYLYEFGGYCFRSREGHTDNVDTFFDDFVFLLDRQAAITARSIRDEETVRYWVEQYGKTLDERDELRGQLDLRKAAIIRLHSMVSLSPSDGSVADAHEVEKAIDSLQRDNVEMRDKLGQVKQAIA